MIKKVSSQTVLNADCGVKLLVKGEILVRYFKDFE